MEINIPIRSLHDGQQTVLDNSKRFNIIRCGRRWGKTEFAIWLIERMCGQAEPVAYFAPTYKDLEPVWDEVKSILLPIVAQKNEATKQLRLITGTTIDFWSLENPDSSRGRAYKRVIIDEARKVPKLEYAWNQTIRATLIDLEGDAWILSSPQGKGTYLNLMYSEATKNENWFTYTASSFENPHLSQTELEEAALTMDDLSYQQEIMGEDVEWTASARFYSAFDRTKHVLPCAYRRTEPLGLSFDFNVDPMTCIAYQTDAHTFFHVIWEKRLPQSDVYEMCQAIKTFFETDHIPNYRVTGDSSGNSRNAGMRGGRSNYDIIRSELYLGSGQIVTPKSNMRIDPSDHAGSRTLVNSVLQNFPDFRIDPSCEWLIKDMEFVLRGLDSKGRVTIKKDDTVNPFINMKNNELSHLADCFVGETMIAVEGGLKRMDAVRLGDMVLTSQGYRPVVDAWSSEADVYEWSFSDGSNVTCTKDHRFKNDSGWCAICSTLEVWKLPTTAGAISSEQASTSAQERASSFVTEGSTNRSGSMPLATFLKAITSTTRMVTDSITNCLTWSALMVASTWRVMRAKGSGRIRNTRQSSYREDRPQPLSGTEVKRALSGTSSTRLSSTSVTLPSVSRDARTVMSRSHYAHGQRKFVPTSASQQCEGGKALTTNKGIASSANRHSPSTSTARSELAHEAVVATKVTVLGGKHLGRRKVYDITVDGIPEFYANGFLVHNCLRYGIHTELKSFLKLPQKAIDLDVPVRRAVTFDPLKVSQS